MFAKRDDGLGAMFLPFLIPAAVLAALLTACGKATGLAAAVVFLLWWAGMFIALQLLFYLLTWLYSLTIDMSAPPMEDRPFTRFLVLAVISQICRYGRVRIHTTGLEKLPAGRYLIVSNHISAFDPILTVWALRKTPVAFITKPENHRIPLAGPLIFGANFLPINREDPREAMKTIQAAATLLKNDVVSVGVYPEGTRNKTPENGLLPFHNGVFKIAQKSAVPLVVGTIRGTESIAENAPWRHTDVYLDIREVIPADELGGSTAAISARVQEILERSPEE